MTHLEQAALRYAEAVCNLMIARSAMQRLDRSIHPDDAFEAAQADYRNAAMRRELATATLQAAALRQARL